MAVYVEALNKHLLLMNMKSFKKKKKKEKFHDKLRDLVFIHTHIVSPLAVLLILFFRYMESPSHFILIGCQLLIHLPDTG